MAWGMKHPHQGVLRLDGPKGCAGKGEGSAFIRRAGVNCGWSSRARSAGITGHCAPMCELRRAFGRGHVLDVAALSSGARELRKSGWLAHAPTAKGVPHSESSSRAALTSTSSSFDACAFRADGRLAAARCRASPLEAHADDELAACAVSPRRAEGVESKVYPRRGPRSALRGCSYAGCVAGPTGRPPPSTGAASLRAAGSC